MRVRALRAAAAACSGCEGGRARRGSGGEQAVRPASGQHRCSRRRGGGQVVCCPPGIPAGQTGRGWHRVQLLSTVTVSTL